MKIFDNYELGSKLHHVYKNSSPFPNIVIDNFLDSNCAHKCFSELKNHKTWGCELPDNDYVNRHQVNKFFTPYDPLSLEDLFLQSPTVFGVLQHLNSPKFVNFLSNLTGIKNLMPDPDFLVQVVTKFKLVENYLFMLIIIYTIPLAVLEY